MSDQTGASFDRLPDRQTEGAALVPFSTRDVGGVPFQVATLESACDWLLDEAARRRPGMNVRMANAYNIALASQHPHYHALLTGSGVNFPDGTPVVWFMRLRRDGLSRVKPGRVRGPSLFERALREGVARGTRHFFLGSTPQTLALLESQARRAFPGIVIAGSYSPPFAAIDDEYVADCAARIRSTAPDIVWIGLGTPKQDELGAALARQLDVVSVNVGAAFDFLAGTVREAPVWVQKSGFEWMYRLLTEPRRLWRRYLIGNLRFLVAAATGLLRDREPRGRGA